MVNPSFLWKVSSYTRLTLFSILGKHCDNGRDTFGHKRIWSPRLIPHNLSPTNSFPMEKWSAKIWSSWTNGPQSIWSPWTNKWSLKYSVCLGGQAVGIRKYRNKIGWGLNMMGTVCPGKSIEWGSFVLGDRKWGTESPGIKWVWDQIRRSWVKHNLCKAS